MTEPKLHNPKPPAIGPQWTLSDSARRKGARVVIFLGLIMLAIGLRFHVVYVAPFGADLSAAKPATDTPSADPPADDPFGGDTGFENPFGNGQADNAAPPAPPEVVGGTVKGEEKPKDPNAPFAMFEPELIKEVTIGGLRRLASGTIQQTYSAEKGEVPEACPT